MNKIDRKIVIFGFDDDERKMEFQWINVEPQLDVDFALQEALEKFPRKHKAAVQKSDLKGYYGYRPYFMVYTCGGMGAYPEYMSDDYNEVRTNAVSEGGGWVVNFGAEETEYVFVHNWENRGQAKNTQEAMEYISTYMAKHFGRFDLKEIEKYAAKFGIPFSADLMGQFCSDFNVHQPQWNSSSAYC